MPPVSPSNVELRIGSCELQKITIILEKKILIEFKIIIVKEIK